LAFALPVLFTVIIGVLQYSLVLFTYCNATYACRIAARYASLHSSTSLAPSTSSQIQSLVTSNLFLSSAITPTVNVTYVTPALVSSTNIVGNVVEVTVSWNQTVAIPFMSSKSLSISSQAYRIISR
jgi:Flp pilus assembly protein TadG